MERRWTSLSALDRRVGSYFFLWDIFNIFLGAMLARRPIHCYDPRNFSTYLAILQCTSALSSLGHVKRPKIISSSRHCQFNVTQRSSVDFCAGLSQACAGF